METSAGTNRLSRQSIVRQAKPQRDEEFRIEFLKPLIEHGIEIHERYVFDGVPRSHDKSSAPAGAVA